MYKKYEEKKFDSHDMMTYGVDGKVRYPLLFQCSLQREWNGGTRKVVSVSFLTRRVAGLSRFTIFCSVHFHTYTVTFLNQHLPRASNYSSAVLYFILDDFFAHLPQGITGLYLCWRIWNN
jgi:hypothetical protein